MWPLGEEGQPEGETEVGFFCLLVGWCRPSILLFVETRTVKTDQQEGGHMGLKTLVSATYWTNCWKSGIVAWTALTV